MQRLPNLPPWLSPLRVVIAIVIVAAVILGFLAATRPPAPIPPDTVRSGDVVEVNYIGFFQNGLVFDTSLPDVAANNATWPKAVSFQPRLNYEPLRFGVGAVPATVIEGFEHGVLFPTPMRVGETREVVVPPEMGYGPTDPSEVEVRPLREVLTQFETLPRTEFITRFGQDPATGLTFIHPNWEWATRVVEASGDFVTIMHLPEVGFILRPFGAWEARVVEVETAANGGLGRVVVLHILDVNDINRVKAEDDRGTFRVVDVNPGAETFTVDYNEEVVGQTLVFRMELVRIDRL
ncbi:MAG: FKBP-type peptidyl-prolyl cis-trans isomerase [Thermoplasmata archaeon]